VAGLVAGSLLGPHGRIAAARAQSTGSPGQPAVRVAANPDVENGGAPSRVVDQDKLLKQVRFDQLLDSQVPLDTPFRDESGKTVPLGTYFGQRPVVMVMIFYNCTMLCSEVLNGLVVGAKQLSYDAGKQYDVVIVSINPKEGPELAAAKKKNYLADLGRPGQEQGWHFLTGTKASIDKVADAIGYHYTYDPSTDQYAHPGGAVVLTPQGKVARYFYGVDFPPRDLKFGIIEASQSKIGSPIDAIFLTCFHYNPKTGKYTLQIMRVVQWVSFATTMLVALFLVAMVQKDRKQQKRQRAEEQPGDRSSGETPL
jgi:protein SCO1/2